jgi:hypothetical protein
VNKRILFVGISMASAFEDFVARNITKIIGEKAYKRVDAFCSKHPMWAVVIGSTIIAVLKIIFPLIFVALTG